MKKIEAQLTLRSIFLHPQIKRIVENKSILIDSNYLLHKCDRELDRLSASVFH
jgi:hypothetical protein